MAATSTQADNFNDNSTDTSLWTAFGPASETNRRLELSSTSGSTAYSGYNSVITTFDLTGSFAFSQLLDAGNQALASFQAIPIDVVKDANNSLIWYIGANTLFAQKQVANVFSNVRADVAYDANLHKFFRIREAAGTIFWDYSRDGASWTNYTSLANPFGITSVQLRVSAGTFSNEGTATTAYFANFNIPPRQGINLMLLGSS